MDVVGDVHGESDALEALLRRLGYRGDGSHPQDRRLVFVGDIVDRGPDSPAVVVGHYWRRLGDAGDILGDKFGPDLFAGVGPHEWMGKRRNVYCVDFSVGRRPRERGRGGPPFEGRLSALRVPEWEVWYDDGSPVAPLSLPGPRPPRAR